MLFKALSFLELGPKQTLLVPELALQDREALESGRVGLRHFALIVSEEPLLQSSRLHSEFARTLGKLSEPCHENVRSGIG